MYKSSNVPALIAGINRIRLEFKESICREYNVSYDYVLIESDWNLKYLLIITYDLTLDVLIESDWNLKCFYFHNTNTVSTVLIESDWNLKGIESNSDLLEQVVLIESDWNLRIT